jgi:tRNA dimethylallyltransferase
MNIGTAKPSALELELIPHHFINHLSVKDEYSAGEFEKDAIQKIDQLFKSHDVLVMTGGSGLFIQAVLEGFNSFPEVNNDVEKDLQRVLDSEGIHGLQDLLKLHDPEYYKKADLRNPRRLLRALAVSISSGQPYSSFKKNRKQTRKFIPLKIGLESERKELYRRIDQRVDRMMREGLVDEVMSLKESWSQNALQTVGYREFFLYNESTDRLEDYSDLIKQHSRNYAKRQMIWFKKDKEIKWFQPGEIKEMIAFIEGVVKEKEDDE